MYKRQALGSELGKYIYNQLGDIGIDYKENLGKYTQLLVNEGYRNEIEYLVRNRFSSLQPSSRFSNIANIPWKAIYTTNYDDLVEKSYSRQRFYNYEVKSSLNVGQSIGAVSYTHLHLTGFNGVQHTHLAELSNKVSNKVVTVVCR